MLMIYPSDAYRKYSRVRKWTLGLTGYKDKIAIIRASGAISRTRGPLSVSSSGIIAEKFIEKIRSIRGMQYLSIYEILVVNTFVARFIYRTNDTCDDFEVLILFFQSS